jgi:hypothetical protein
MSSLQPVANPGSGRPLPVPTRLVAREILSAAWPLFKACLPLCLPLAVIGVAAGATPSAEAALDRAAHDTVYDPEWWGVAMASTALMLICYGAVLRLQMALAAGGRLPLLDAIRRAAMDLPLVLPLLVLQVAPLLPAMVVTAWLGFGVPAALLTLAAGASLVYGWFAWPALATYDAGAGARSPFTALALSFQLVHGRWRAIALIAGTLLAAILVFVLLIGIFIGVVMGLAGQSNPTAQGLAFSRWLMALVLAVPVVYGGAVTVTVWRAGHAMRRFQA